MYTKRVHALFTVAVMLLTLIHSLAVPISAEDINTTVRVGYFQMEGYNEIDEDGLYSGYDYDFLQLLERYTDLNFEYVGYDKSWQDMQDMLSNGEIDILTSMHSTEERNTKYEFSYDIGSSYTMLTTQTNNSQYKSGEYSSYDGMVVGMIRESSQNDVFEEFAQENGFSYSAVYFNNTYELSQAVQDGTVDSAVTSSLRKLHGERVLEEISPSPFYVAVAKGNTTLLDEINQGITQMDIYDGDWRNTLYYRYYGYQEDSLDDIVYSDRELAVMDEYSNGNKSLTICFDPTLVPYSFVEDGKMVGILPDAISQTLDSIGIDYEFIITTSHSEYQQLYDSGSADIFPEVVADSTVNAQRLYLFTDSYFNIRVGMLTNKSLHKTINTVALLNNETFYNDLSFTDTQVLTFDTTDEVINAILNGTADATYLMNYTAQMYLNSERLNELSYVSRPDIYYTISFAVNKNAPHEFCSILNKNISNISSQDFYSLSLEYIETDMEDLNFVEYMQLHPRTAIVFFVIIIVLVVVVMVLIFMNSRKNEREKQQRDLQEAYHRTEMALADAQQYRHAVLSDAFVVYDVNISKNLLEEEVCEEYGNNKYKLLSRLDLTVPCKYDDYIDKLCRKMTDSEYRELFRKKTNRNYLLKLFEDGKTEDVFEYRTTLINGQIAEIRHTTYLTRDINSNDIIAHINNKNITDQKTNERQVRKYEQILITTATDTFKGVRRVSLDTQHTEYIRFDNGQIIQTYLGNWTNWLEKQRANVHPDDYDKLRNFLCIENLSNLEVGVSFKHDYRSYAQNEKNINRVYTTTVSIIYVDNKKVAIMTTIDNTSAVESEMEQKRLLEDALRSAEKANLAKTTFLSNMSHDIRTPMNAIIGFTSLAKAHIDNSQQVQDYLNKISSSSMHLLSLINDVLDMSRIESGRLHLDKSENDLFELIHDIYNIILPNSTEKGLKVSINTSRLCNGVVVCDKLRLKRVLLNLLDNAMKFTKAGGSICLDVVQKSTSEDDIPLYEFHVKDTGIGMSKEFIEHVFEPFERERNSTVSGVQGTGLGMSISKNIVDMMGGKISVTSVQGEGSEFVVAVPLKKALLKDTSTTSKSTPTISNRLKGKRVLLVEDNELNREIAFEILSSVGLLVEDAEDGNVAVDMLLNNPSDYYTLVLMDIQMPTMDGYTATKHIRAFNDKRLANVPIIAMTANAFEEDKQKAISVGMNAHIAKPISIEELLSTMEQVAQEHESIT